MLKNSNFFEKWYRVRLLMVGGVLVPGAAWLAPVVAQAQAVSYAAPIVITKGGTYTGNYQSLTSGTPCVLVATSEPVVLDGCQLAGAGNLIQAGQGVNLTVRNCRGQALTPTVDNQTPGRFIDVYMPQSLVVEHNTLTGTTGIGINRWSNAGTAGKTLTVRYNRVSNIDGRWRNGGGTHSSFVLLNTVQHLAGVEVAYNEVINTPDQSLVEDNINLFNSSGTASSPLRVHDNFVRGAYPIPATVGGFTGSGMTTDGDANTVAEAASYIEADHNQFLSTGNAAMNIAAGHDIYYHDNRLVSSGYLADGRKFLGGYVGLGVFNFYNQPTGVFGNNRVENNTIGFVRWGGHDPGLDRQDEAPDACAPCAGTIHLPNPITPATEDNEWQLWQQKLQQNGVVVGPTTGGVTPTPLPTAVGTVANPSFEADGVGTGTPTGWQKTLGAGTSAQTAYTESYTGGHTGTYHGTHYSLKAYEAYTYQVVTGLASGTYSLSAWVKSSGGQATAQLRASNYGGALVSTGIGATAGGVTAAGWALVTVANIAVSNGQCEIGFYSNAGAGGQAIYFDDVTLVKQQNTPPTVTLTASANLSLGQPLVLSATAADTDGTVAKVEFFNGTTKLGESVTTPYQLSWKPTTIGSYSLTAVATDNAGASTTSAAVTVVVVVPPIVVPTAPIGTATNLAANPSFEADGVGTGTPTGWQKTLGAGTSAQTAYTESYTGGHTGTYHGTHYSLKAYEAYTYQVVTGLASGTYSLSAWVKSSGGQATAQLRASNYGGALVSTGIGATAGGVTAAGWALVTVANIAVSNGQCEIGFYSNAGAGGQAIYFDDVTLVAQSVANSLLNASFDDDQAPVQSPQRWTTQTWGNTQANVSYTEAYGGAHTGTYHGTHYDYNPESYKVYTYQTVSNLANGTYTLSAWVRSSGGQPKVQLQASNYGKGSSAVDIAATPNGQWAQVVIPGIVVSNGQCEVGFYSQANKGQSLYFDDVALIKQEASNAKAALAEVVEVAPMPTLYPNPASDRVTITTSFAQASEVVLLVTDLQGTLIAKYKKQAVAGSNQLVVDTSNLPSGIYILQILSSEASSVQHLEIRH